MLATQRQEASNTLTADTVCNACPTTWSQAGPAAATTPEAAAIAAEGAALLSPHMSFPAATQHAASGHAPGQDVQPKQTLARLTPSTEGVPAANSSQASLASAHTVAETAALLLPSLHSPHAATDTYADTTNTTLNPAMTPANTPAPPETDSEAFRLLVAQDNDVTLEAKEAQMCPATTLTTAASPEPLPETASSGFAETLTSKASAIEGKSAVASTAAPFPMAVSCVQTVKAADKHARPQLWQVQRVLHLVSA